MKSLLSKMETHIAKPLPTLVLFILFVLSYITINGSWIGVAKLLSMSNGVGILDLMPGYTPEQAFHLINALGDAGRTFYLQILLPQDFAFPLIYGLFYFGFMTLLIKTLFGTDSKWRYLAVMPLLAFIFDWIENIFIIVLLTNYQTKIPTIATFSSIFTTAKFAMTGISMVSSLILLIVFGLRFIIRSLKPVN